MPISDQVIELETKKKGRNVIFIILISLFAAAAVAFAVLWATTEKVAPPPSVEKISVGATDMCLVDDSTEQYVYSVSPQCSYSITFDVVLRGSTVDNYDEENNPVLTFSTDPAGAITKLASSGVDPENPNRYVFNFRVGALGTALQDGTVIELMLSSVYSVGVSNRVYLRVEQPFVEYFDIVAQEGSNEKQVSGVSTKKTFELSAVESKSDGRTNYYEVTLPYYSGELEKQNERYEVSFEQFGKTGLNNELAKIMQNVAVEGGKRFDQVKVEVADKEDPSESDYKEILDDGGDKTFTHTANLNLDLNPDPRISNYCRTFFRFWANDDIGSCSSTIRLTANAYNGGSTPYYIIIVVHFESTDDTDAITQITVYDPYSGAATNELDMYLGDFSSETPFDISQFVKVTVRGKETKPRWGTNYLFGYVSDANGANGNTRITKNPSQTYDCAIAPNSTEWTGDAYVTLEDRNPDGFNVRKTITIHIRPKATSFTMSGKGNTFEKDITLNMYSGKSEEVDIRYSISNTLKAENVAENLNTVVGVSYASDNGKDIRPVFAENLESKEYEVRNGNKAIVVTGLTVNHTVTPEPAADKSVATRVNSSIEITVGKEVADGKYVLEFTMRGQALALNDGVYSPADSMKCKVTIIVTRLATSLCVDTDYDFTENEEDKYTEMEGKRGAKEATATLRLAAGTGVGGYTVFKLSDILLYYYEDSSDPILDAANSNFSELKFSTVGDSKVDTIIGNPSEGYQFALPKQTIADRVLKVTMPSGYSLVITVKYYYAVGYFRFNSTNTSHEVSYPGNIQSGGFQLGNGALDDFNVYSTGGQRITSTDQLMHPELLNIDVVVLRGSNSQYVLPKKFNKENGRWYYFMVGTDVNAADCGWEKAVLRCGYENMLDSAGVSKTHNLSIMKDLFSLSVANMSNPGGGNDIDYQEFCIYYSYGDDVFTTNGEIVQGVKNDYAIYSRYTCERQLDSIRFYETNNYLNEIERVEGSDNHFRVARLSGATIEVFYSGVIELNDYSELLGISFDDSYLVSGGKYEFVERRHNIAPNGRKLACSGINMSSSNANENDRIVPIDKESGQYKVECTKGSVGVSCGSFTCTSSSNANCTATLNVFASNRAVAIHEIKVYSDPEHENELTELVLYNDGSHRYTVYYTVCYEQYVGDEETLDEIDRTYSSEIFSFVEETDMPNYSRPGDLANDSNNRIYVYYGALTLAVKSNVSSADRAKIEISGRATDITATVAVKVTTSIDDCFGVVRDDEEGKIGFAVAGTEDESVMKANPVPCEYTVGKVANFAFDFATDNGAKVDTRNLAFTAEWQDVVMTAKQIKASGIYWAKNYHGMTLNKGEGVNAESFRIEFGSVKIDGAVLKLTVKEELPAAAGEEPITTTYVLYLEFTVNVPIRNGVLTIKSDDMQKNYSANGGSFDLYSVKESGTEEYSLEYTLNDADADLQPRNPVYGYSLVADDNGVFSLGGDKLVVDYSKLKALSATATLTVTVSDDATNTEFTRSVTLNVYFEGKEIKFSKVDGGYKQATNANIDCSILVKNLRAEEWKTVSSVSGARVTYSLEGAPAGVTIGETSGLVRISNVDKATFTVKAVYTDAYNAEIVRRAEITVSVSANRILITAPDGNTFNNSIYAMLKGNTSGEFTVAVSSNVATLTDPTFGIGVEGSAVSVIREEGSAVYKLKANHYGEATITITVDDEGKFERTFKVVVLEPTLTATVASSSFDVLSRDNYVIVNLGLEGGAYDGVEYYKLSDVTDLAVESAYQSAVIGNIVQFGSTKSVWHVYIKRSEITDSSALKAYSFSVSGKIGESYGMDYAAEDLFTLVMSDVNFVPQLNLTSLGSLTGGDRYVLNSWVTAENYYIVSIGNMSIVPSFTSFGEGALGVTYSVSPSNALTFDDDGYSASIGFTGNYIGDAVITVTVELLGRTFTNSIDVTVEDTGRIDGYIYGGAIDSELGDTAPENFISKSDIHTGTVGTLAIDYDGEISPKQVISLAINLKNVPVIMNRLKAEDITVTVVGDAVVRRTQTAPCYNGKWLVIEYEAVGAGVAEFTARATVDGRIYTMPTIGIEFTATAPFTASSAVTEKELVAGSTANNLLVLTPASGFKGIVEYTYSCSSPALAEVTGTKSNGGYAVSVYAKTGVDSGSATITVTATVRGGVFDGKQYLYTLQVSVIGANAPVVRTEGMLAYADKTVNVDTAAIIKVYNVSDGGALTLMPSGDYTVELTGNGVTKEGNAHKFTAPAGNYSGGAVIEVGYTVTVTAQGANRGRVLGGKFEIAVAPTAVTFTANGKSGDTSVAPYDDLSLNVAVGSLSESEYKVVYTVSDAAAGNVSDGLFTAKLYGGTVTLTAKVTVTGGRYVGATYTADKQVTVNMLELKGETGLSLVAGGELTLAADMFAAVNTITAVTVSDAYASVNGLRVSVSPDANYGSADKTMIICVTATTSGGEKYYGEFRLTVKPLPTPEISVDKTAGDNGEVILTVTEVSGASYGFEVLAGEDLVESKTVNDNVATFVLKANTAGGTVVVRAKLTVSGGIYAGGVYDGTTLYKTESFEVTAADVPTDANLKVTAENGQIAAVLVGLNGYGIDLCTYELKSGSGIILSADGGYTFVPAKNEQTATVTVTAVISGTPYKNLVLKGEVVVNVPKADRPTLETTDTEISAMRGSIAAATVSDGTAATFTYTVEAGKSGVITLSGTNYSLLDKNFEGDIVVNVTAKLGSGVFKDEILTGTITLTVLPKAAVSAVTLKRSADSVYNGTLEYTGEGVSVIACMVADPESAKYVSITGNNYVITPASEPKTVNLTVWYEITAEEWYGLATSVTLEVPVEAAPSLGLTESEEDRAIDITLSGCEYAYFNVGNSDYEDTFAYEDGRIIITDYDGTRPEEKTVTVTVTATVTEGYFAGETLTEAITVTIIVERPLAPTLALSNDEQGVIAVDAFDCTWNGFTLSDDRCSSQFFTDDDNSRITYTDYSGSNYEAIQVKVTVTARVEDGRPDLTEEITVTVKIERPLDPKLTLAEENGAIKITATDCTYKSYAVNDTAYNGMFRYENGSIVITEYEGARGEDKPVTVTVTASVEDGRPDITEEITVTIKVERPLDPKLTLVEENGAIKITATDCTYKEFSLGENDKYRSQFSLDAANNRIIFTDYTEGEWEEVTVTVTVTASVEDGRPDITEEITVTIKVEKPLDPKLTLVEENGAIKITATDCTYKEFSLGENGKYASQFSEDAANNRITFTDYTEGEWEEVTVTVTVTASVKDSEDITETIDVTLKVAKTVVGGEEENND